MLIIDTQDCFIEQGATTSGDAGSLAVADTAAILPLINQIRAEKGCLFDVVVRSQDYHPAGHISFGPTHGLEPFAHLAGLGELPLTCVNPSSGMSADASCCPTFHLQPYNCTQRLCPSVDTASADLTAQVMASPACTICQDTPEECFETTQAMWTNHCLQSGDSGFPPTLVNQDSDIVVQKGGNAYVDSYSAFADNTKRLQTKLDGILKENDVDTIYILGIATDYCVYYSTIDGLGLGYEMNLVLDATRGIAPDTVELALADMLASGAKVVNSTELLAMACPAPTSGGAAWNNYQASSILVSNIMVLLFTAGIFVK